VGSVSRAGLVASLLRGAVRHGESAMLVVPVLVVGVVEGFQERLFLCSLYWSVCAFGRSATLRYGMAILLAALRS
jgi:hypothetical protein